MKKLLLLLLFSTSIFAQQKIVTSIDTTKNKIGAEFKLTLKTSVYAGTKVVFPKLKNIGALEVIQSYPIDTVKKGDRNELIKKYGLTQFDSGKYTIPSIKILINNKAFLTDSLKVEVATVQVDTLRQKMYDIKNIVKAETSWVDWWKYVLGILLILGIAAFVYWYTKIHQKKKIEEEVYKTPIEKATSLLNTLEKKELWQHGEVKAYYSELTDITRNYIEEAIKIPAMESTTSELIAGLKVASLKKKMKLSQETIENLFTVLKQADLVKFAKSKPLEFEINEDRNKIQKAILTLDESIPEEVPVDEEELLLNEAQKQKQIKILLRKKRRERIIVTVLSVFLLISTTTIYFMATMGYNAVVDTVFGHPTKALLEGEWVKSEYGNPGVVIETPKVLKRIDLTKTLPKDGMALIKEMQSFGYGGLLDNFYIMVSTIKYKKEQALDLSQAIESSLQILESQGAQNMIVKQEDFKTNAGITGKKGFGTFTRIDDKSKSSSKIYYEILLFGQQGGLQQIMILHEEGDRYATELTNRILNSVELKTATK